MSAAPPSPPTGGRLPALFIGHGSPMNALADNDYTRALVSKARELPRPRAILCISAHWYTRGTGVTAMHRPRTIHDFGGFPQALFDMQYPAPGDPELAARVEALLAPWPVTADQGWGLDHGAWQVLVHLYPRADVPVVQLSLDATQPARVHYDLGRRLLPLRDQGILVLGSGNIVHNLRTIDRREDAPVQAWAEGFGDAVRTALAARDHDRLIDFATLHPEAARAVPTPDHYLPMLYILGMQQPDEEIRVFTQGFQYGSLDMTSFAISG